jgi:ATP-binding cassette subfamily B protein
VHDFGRHDELLERCDIYSDLWHQQNQHVTNAAQRQGKPPYGGPRRVS